MDPEIRETMRFLQLENTRLQEANEELREELAKLHTVIEALSSLQEVSTSVNTKTDLFGLMDRILQSALICIGASDGSLLLLDDETNELVFVVVHGSVRDTLLGYRLQVGEGISGWVAQHGRPVIVGNVRADPRFSPDVDQTFKFQTQSMLSVPILFGEQVLGVIDALNKSDGQEFNDRDIALLGVVAQLAATAMIRADSVIED